MTDARPAPLRHRLFARVMDVVTLGWAVGFVLVELDQRLLGGDPFGQRPLQVDLGQTRSVLLLLLTIAAYEVVPTVLWGATLGKALMGLRVVSIDGPAAWLMATVRAVVLYGAPLAFGAYGGFVLLALFVTAAVPASGRGLHDRISGSQVVLLGEADA